ncbi:hypothetical protein BJY01DRAFT_11245 [Aspergillus pseudoustus]|uniref:Uncharacterized protein n=1 Tax=Aspergillus pseudoustus TaxID=1810923 RepID=A0ABR4KSV1_9EURO
MFWVVYCVRWGGEIGSSGRPLSISISRSAGQHGAASLGNWARMRRGLRTACFSAYKLVVGFMRSEGPELGLSHYTTNNIPRCFGMRRAGGSGAEKLLEESDRGSEARSLSVVISFTCLGPRGFGVEVCIDENSTRRTASDGRYQDGTGVKTSIMSWSR